MDRPPPVIEFLTKYLDLIGINPLKPVNLYKIVTLVILLLTTLLLSIYKFYIEEITFKSLITGADSIITVTHVLMKLSIIIVNRQQIRILFENSRYFLSLDHLDDNFKKSYQNQLRFIEFLVRLFIVFVGIFLCINFLKPIVLKELVLDCYIPEFIPFPLFAIGNSLLLIFGGAISTSSDFLLFVLIDLIRLQYQVLNRKITLLGIGREDDIVVEKRIKLWIQDHDFIYNYLQVFNSFAGWNLFFYLIIFIVSLCLELFIFTKNVGDYVVLLESFMYLTGLSSELVLYYCWPATRLADEASQTLFCFYDTEWFNCRSKVIKNDLLIIMTRLQQDDCVCFGRLFAVDFTIATQAFKTAISYYSSLTAIENN